MKRQPAPPLSFELRKSRELWIDVSHHQGSIDWSKVRDGEVDLHHRGRAPRRLGLVEGVVVRIGEGKDVDRRALENLQGAAEAGLREARDLPLPPRRSGRR